MQLILLPRLFLIFPNQLSLSNLSSPSDVAREETWKLGSLQAKSGNAKFAQEPNLSYAKKLCN